MIGFQILLLNSGTSGTLGIIYDALTFAIYSNTVTLYRVKLLIKHPLFALLCRIFIIYCSGPAICHRALVMAECQRCVRNPLIRIHLWIAAVIQIDLWLRGLLD